MSTFNVNDIPEPHPIFNDVAQDLYLPESINGEEQLRYMRAALRRQPKNLRRHVQYILMLVRAENKDPAAVKSALIDLFIVLGTKGVPLRERMLAHCKKILSAEDIVFFKQHLTKALTEKSHVDGKIDSFMTLSISGDGSAIVRPKESVQKQDFSLFDEAVSLIEQGEVDEARVLLERALKAQPDEEKIAEELLAIYQSQRDYEALAGARQWYLDNDLALPACWPLM